MKKRLKKFLFVIEIAFFSFVFFFIVNGIIENVDIDRKIRDFMNKGVCSEVIDQTTGKVVLCKVSRETYYPEAIHKTSIEVTNNSIYIGSVGDIFVRKTSPFNIPVFYEFVTYFIGGHANMATSKKNTIIEIAATGKDDIVAELPNNWGRCQTPVIGLRVKDATLEDYQNAYLNAYNKIGEKYNYSFLFNTKHTHYCTDLISKSWQEVDNKFNLNDGFATTINDLINSKNTYIFFYQYLDGNNVRYIYYLE